MSPKKTSAPRSRPGRARAPPGKYAQDGPQIIGYAILLLAVMLVAIGSMLS